MSCGVVGGAGHAVRMKQWFIRVFTYADKWHVERWVRGVALAVLGGWLATQSQRFP